MRQGGTAIRRAPGARTRYHPSIGTLRRHRPFATALAVTTVTALVLLPLASAEAAARPHVRAADVSWTVRFSAAPAIPWEGLSCPRPGTCVAVGGASLGVVERTVNGGASWAREALPEGTGALEWVSCGSSTTCVAGGWSSPSDVDVTASFLVSHDAGVHWTMLPTRPNQPGDLESLACAGAVCNAIGVGGSPYYRSTNDGATWSEPAGNAVLRAVEPGLFGLACPTASTCYAAGTGGIVKLTDASNSYTYVAGYPSYTLGGQPLSSISCATSSVCAVAGLGGRGHTVAWTRDGGRSWSLTRIPAALGPTMDLSCSGEATCTLVGLANASSDTPDLVAVSTTDRGARWAVRPFAPMAYPGNYPGLTAGGIDCDAGRCVAAGFSTPESTIMASPSPGSPWVTRSVGGGAPALSGTACASGTVCLAVGGGSVYRSTDGGSTWDRAAFHAPPADMLTSVACASVDYCVAGAIVDHVWPHPPTSVAFTSSDGGATWTQVPAGAKVPSAITCVSASVCLGVPAQGGLLRTVDGGSIWSTVTTLPPDEIVSNASCDSAGDCVVTGSWVGQGEAVDSDAALSTDGGASWTTVSAPGGWGQLDCVSGASCYGLTNDEGPQVSSYASTVLSTSDGGNHWALMSAPSTLVSLVCSATVCGGVAAANTPNGWPGPTSLWTASIGQSGLTWTQSNLPSSIDDLGGLTQSPSGTMIVLGQNAEGGPVILSDG